MLSSKHWCWGLVVLVGLVTNTELQAQPKGQQFLFGKLPFPFTVAATAAKPNAGGQQQITIVVTLNPGLEVHANPVGNESLEMSAFRIHVRATGKTLPAKIDYPAGQKRSEPILGDYKVYQGTVTIRAVVERLNVPGPLEIALVASGFNDPRYECLVVRMSVVVPES